MTTPSSQNRQLIFAPKLPLCIPIWMALNPKLIPSPSLQLPTSSGNSCSLYWNRPVDSIYCSFPRLIFLLIFRPWRRSQIHYLVLYLLPPSDWLPLPLGCSLQSHMSRPYGSDDPLRASQALAVTRGRANSPALALAGGRAGAAFPGRRPSSSPARARARAASASARGSCRGARAEQFDDDPTDEPPPPVQRATGPSSSRGRPAPSLARCISRGTRCGSRPPMAPRLDPTDFAALFGRPLPPPPPLLSRHPAVEHTALLSLLQAVELVLLHRPGVPTHCPLLSRPMLSRHPAVEQTTQLPLLLAVKLALLHWPGASTHAPLGRGRLQP